MANEEKITTASDVLTMLIPSGGWVVYGNDFETIRYDEGVEPITKQQFDDGFLAYEKWQNEQMSKDVAAKQAILDRLGINAEEAALLLK